MDFLSKFLKNGSVVAEIGMIEGGPPPSEAFWAAWDFMIPSSVRHDGYDRLHSGMSQCLVHCNKTNEKLDISIARLEDFLFAPRSSPFRRFGRVCITVWGLNGFEQLSKLFEIGRFACSDSRKPMMKPQWWTAADDHLYWNPYCNGLWEMQRKIWSFFESVGL